MVNDPETWQNIIGGLLMLEDELVASGTGGRLVPNFTEFNVVHGIQESTESYFVDLWRFALP